LEVGDYQQVSILESLHVEVDASVPAVLVYTSLTGTLLKVEMHFELIAIDFEDFEAQMLEILLKSAVDQDVHKRCLTYLICWNRNCRNCFEIREGILVVGSKLDY
jgi:hypothetical protein